MDTESKQPSFLSVPQAAKYCGVTRNTFFNWVRQEKIKAYQTPGRTNHIRPADLVDFMREHGMFIPPDLDQMGERDREMYAALKEQQIDEEKFSLLVVDDESSIRLLLSKTMQSICPVYQAETGYEALHLLTKHPNIRVVLLDLRMPGQHGLDTFNEIISTCPDVKVAIVSGFLTEEVRQAVEGEGFGKVFPKPFNADEVKAFVIENLQAARGEALEELDEV
jgi:excisionase family DNA binding protein